jgi:hypothetical protein
VIKGEFKLRRFVLGLACLLPLALFSVAQNSLEPSHLDPSVPAVTFELDWKAADPAWYQVTVSQNGDATYESKSHVKDNEPETEPYRLQFIMSQPTRAHIFRLAAALNDFNGKFETRAKVAQTGKKTLTFRQGEKESKTTVNYSDNQQMNELIGLFQRMSTTFEVAQKLDFDLRFDKLGLDRDLKILERLDKDNQLLELQVIAPTLERIANDSGIMNIARQKARVLLQRSRPTAAQR